MRADESQIPARISGKKAKRNREKGNFARNIRRILNILCCNGAIQGHLGETAMIKWMKKKTTKRLRATLYNNKLSHLNCADIARHFRKKNNPEWGE